MEENSLTFFIDAGDAFFKTPYVVQSKREELEALGRAILSSYNVMGCKLMNVGSKDLAAGPDYIKSLQSQADFPFISANIQLVGSSDLLFAPSAILKTPELKLGFVGISSADPKLKEFAFADPLEAATKAITELSGKVDLVFLLANVDDQTEEQLIKEVKGIDFLIRSHTGRRYQKPKEENGIITIRNGNQGKYAGVLEVKMQDPKAQLKDISAQMKRIDFANSRLNAMKQGLEEGVSLEEHFADDSKRLELINRLKSERADNEELITKLNNTYYFNPVALDEKIEDTPEVAALVADFMVDHTVDKAKAKQKEVAHPG